MDSDNQDEPDTADELIESFILANHADLKSDPTQALERIDRFLARFPAISEEDRRKIKEGVLGRLH